SRALLGAAGAALAVSLFLPWFDGVSGWEHWAWADAPFAALAILLVASAALPGVTALRMVAGVLCGVGISVVLGHGFAPDEPTGEVLRAGAGGYGALGALSAGVIGALAAWARWGSVLLLVAGAAGIVAALLSAWGPEGDVLVLFGDVDRLAAQGAYEDGFERWRVLDVALLALAAGLVGAATGRLPRVGLAVLGLASVAAAACVLIGVRDQLWVDEGVAIGAAKGPLVALFALAAAVAGLALLRPRERAPAARAG
ncbi:MAG TPA: hypothetical protein VGV67_04445, partial [Solirubrobacteraceae bacterium]|nr:hypothetical protein [Solirubrobacteraceae bacterium]